MLVLTTEPSGTSHLSIVNVQSLNAGRIETIVNLIGGLVMLKHLVTAVFALSFIFCSFIQIHFSLTIYVLYLITQMGLH